MVDHAASPHLLTLRGICCPHLVQLHTVNRSQLAVDIPNILALALGGRWINCAEVGTLHVWNFFEVSIPLFPLIPSFLSFSLPPLFLSLSLPLLVHSSVSSFLCQLYFFRYQSPN